MGQTVLLTGAGLRVDLVRVFRRAGAFVVAVDSDPWTPALHEADVGAALPPADSDDYLLQIVKLIQDFDVDVVVPLTDHDLVVLSRNEELLPALLFLSDLSVVEAMQDKHLAVTALAEHGIMSPPTWLPKDLPNRGWKFPLLVKKRLGTGGKDIHVVRDWRDLSTRVGRDYVVQTICDGDEFSVDVLCDMDGRCLQSIPRQTMFIRGGEAIQVKVVDDQELVEFGVGVAEALPLKGAAMVQLFRVAGELLVIDVNPRFGGSMNVTTTVACNPSYAQLVLAIARGENVRPMIGQYEAGLVVTRYWSEFVLDGDSRRRDLETRMQEQLEAAPIS